MKLLKAFFKTIVQMLAFGVIISIIYSFIHLFILAFGDVRGPLIGFIVMVFVSFTALNYSNLESKKESKDVSH